MIKKTMLHSMCLFVWLLSVKLFCMPSAFAFFPVWNQSETETFIHCAVPRDVSTRTNCVGNTKRAHRNMSSQTIKEKSVRVCVPVCVFVCVCACMWWGWGEYLATQVTNILLFVFWYICVLFDIIADTEFAAFFLPSTAQTHRTTWTCEKIIWGEFDLLLLHFKMHALFLLLFEEGKWCY